jgi:hypothetical protein
VGNFSKHVNFRTTLTAALPLALPVRPLSLLLSARTAFPWRERSPEQSFAIALSFKVDAHLFEMDLTKSRSVFLKKPIDF